MKPIMIAGDTFRNTIRGKRPQAVATIIRCTDKIVRFKYATGVIDEIAMSLFAKMFDDMVFTDYTPISTI